MSKSSQNLLKFRARSDSLTSFSKDTNVASRAAQKFLPGSLEGQPKKFLRNTGFNQVINEIIISICRKYLEMPMRKRIIYYLYLVIFGGILSDFMPNFLQTVVPFKSEKHHFLNVYFVKLGWFWTTLFIVPFLILTQRVIENRRHWFEWKDLGRVILATGLWFLSTSLFIHIEHATGSCSHPTIRSKDQCSKGGHYWHGFDISGHTFILLYSALMIIEEAKVMIGFENFGYLLDSRAQYLKKMHDKHCDHNALYAKYLIPIRVLFICLTLLNIVWDFMLIQTVLFYHSFFQKLLAYFWAVFLWYITYKLLYPSRFLNILCLPERPPQNLPEHQE